MKVLNAELIGDKAVVTLQGNVNDRVRDLRALALSALPRQNIALNSERVSGYKNVTTFTYDLVGVGGGY